MVSKERAEKLVTDCFPSCPLCGSSLGWIISGINKNYFQCKSCAAKWRSDDLAYGREPEETMLWEPCETGKGSELLRKKRSTSFWKDLDTKQLEAEEQRLMREKKPEAEIPAKKVPTTQIAVGVIIFLIIIGITFWWMIPKTTTATIRIECDTSWSGSIGGDAQSRTVEGSENREIKVTGSIIVAVIQKQTSYGTLRVSVVVDGRVVASETTTAEYGVVTVSWNA